MPRQELKGLSSRPTHSYTASMYTVSIPMSFAQRSLSLAGIIGVLTAAFAAGLIYLLVTQPVSTAENIANGEVSPIVRAVAGVLYDALRGILKYL